MRFDHLTAHIDGLARLAGQLLDDHHGGHDVAQEALARALVADEQPADAHEAGPWLRTIVRRLASNERRARARRRAAEGRLADERPDVAPSSAEIAARADAARRLMDRIGELPKRDASALLDRYVGGLGTAAIARRDGVSVNTVKARLRRARAALRASLERDGLRPDEPWALGLAPLLIPRRSGSAAGELSPSLLLGFATMVRPLTIAVGALLVVLLAAWFRAGANDLMGTSPALDTEVRRVAEVSHAPPTGSESSVPSMEREAVDEEPQPSTATIAGRVIDTAGQPIEGARVTVETHAWRNGERLAISEVSASTRADGHFELEVRSGETWRHTLRVTPGPHHVTETIRFPDRRRRRAGRLGAERRDLGEIMLARAGSATGRVVDPDGEPIAAAFVEVAPGHRGHYGLIPRAETHADHEGFFQLAHVPTGRLEVRVEAEGHASRVLEELDFKAGQELSIGDVVLPRAGIIAGRVVTPDGVPIAGASVSLDPADQLNGDISGARTGEDGAFRVQLKAAAPHRMRVRATGFLEITFRDEDAPVIPEGTFDAEIVLTPLEMTTFRILDGATGEPLEAFGVRVAQDGAGTSHRRLRYYRVGARAYPDGLAQRPARSGIDAVVVDAPGYLPFVGDVLHDDGEPGMQTIELVPARPARGRVVRHGQGVADAVVEVIELVQSNEGSVQEAVTAEDGSFRTVGLGPGKYELRARSADRLLQGSAAVTIRKPDPASTDDHDLPVLTLADTGTVRGRVLLPSTLPSDGVCVFLGDWGGAERIPVTDSGTFTIEGVPAGSHTLRVAAPPGRLGKVRTTPIVVVEGEVTTVEVDASASAVGWALVDVTLIHDEVDAGDCTAWLAREEYRFRKQGLPELVTPSGAVPDLAPSGRATIEGAAPGTSYLQLHPPGRPVLVITSAPVEMIPGQVVRLDVQFQPAILEIEVPGEAYPQGTDTIAVDLRDSRFSTPVQTFRLSSGNSRFQSLPINDGVATLDFAACGDLELVARWPSESGERPRTSMPVQLRPGRTTRVALVEPTR